MTELAQVPSTQNRFARNLQQHQIDLTRLPIEVLQVNVGRLCNQACNHCHVSAGPWRTEIMTEPVADACIRFLDRVPSIHTLDITGGAPEMAPVFRKLAAAGHARGKHVIDRCNLTILEQPGHEDLAEFLAAHKIHVIASLPCYTAGNVNKQRGEGVFEASINGLRKLNALGYGEKEGESALRLDLVYNPLGPALPPPQAKLQADYRARLKADFGVRFDRLLALTNLPIGRFRGDLRQQGKLDGYLDLLDANFNPATVPGVMCRTYLSVDHLGQLYDCDFNQMLGIPLGGGAALNIATVTEAEIDALAIETADHCLGCTAGCGSSCAGTLLQS